jgi:hypothetical protein
VPAVEGEGEARFADVDPRRRGGLDQRFGQRRVDRVADGSGRRDVAGRVAGADFEAVTAVREAGEGRRRDARRPAARRRVEQAFEFSRFFRTEFDRRFGAVDRADGSGVDRRARRRRVDGEVDFDRSAEAFPFFAAPVPSLAPVVLVAPVPAVVPPRPPVVPIVRRPHFEVVGAVGEPGVGDRRFARFPFAGRIEATLERGRICVVAFGGEGEGHGGTRDERFRT